VKDSQLALKYFVVVIVLVMILVAYQGYKDLLGWTELIMIVLSV
jgi:hypothetical protein